MDEQNRRDASTLRKDEKKLGKLKWRSVIIIALVVIAIGAFVGVGLLFEKQYQDQLKTEAGKEAKVDMTYFVSNESEPEKSETNVTALITKMYYTNDGSLAVQLCFANGMEKAQHLTSVEVEIRNGQEEVIATGFSDAIQDEYTIPADGTAMLLLYISPEYVQIADDPLSTISYDVTTNCEEVE